MHDAGFRVGHWPLRIADRSYVVEKDAEVAIASLENLIPQSRHCQEVRRWEDRCNTTDRSAQCERCLS